MNEKLLLRISLIISILGISLLLIVSLTQEPKLVKINQINKTLLNQKIKTAGYISKIITLKDFQIIALNDSKEVEIINNNPKNLSKNQRIIVIGKIQEYKNQLQINSEKLYVTTLKLS